MPVAFDAGANRQPESRSPDAIILSRQYHPPRRQPLTRGGVFMYPWDKREPDKPGKLRLMYEANPMGWLVEQAGGSPRVQGDCRPLGRIEGS